MSVVIYFKIQDDKFSKAVLQSSVGFVICTWMILEGHPTFPGNDLP